MIHQYQNNGYNIVMDVYSGSVHVVDDVCYDVIAEVNKSETEPTAGSLKEADVKEKLLQTLGNKYETSDIEDALSDVIELTEGGQLFVKDTYECMIEEVKKRKTVVKALCLHIAHDCNLACKYCFAEEGEYHGRRALMSYEVGKKALDFLVANSGSRRNLEVDFFGGEPLMNWQVVKDLVAYGREQEKKYNKNFRFTLTTNGLLINDDVINFCNKEMGNVVLSLDGRKSTNDLMRVSRNGKGSYDLIVDKFKKFADSRNQKDYYMRGTYTRNNLDFAKDIIHMADLGFKELSIEPVVSDPKEPYALKEEDLPILKEQYQILADEMLKRYRNGKGFTFYHYMIDLDAGPCIVKRVSGCGVGTEYMAVTPSGELYPCHQFVGDERFLLGDIWKGVTNKKVLEQFEECNVYSHKECKDCFAKLYCSGGCSANAYHTTGSVNGVYDFGCELHRKRIECAIMLKVAEAEEGFKVEY